MIPVKFDESNRVFTAPEGMENCQDLHTFQNDEQIISCWEMTPDEKISALFFGRVWLYIWGQGMPPVSLLAAQSAFSNEDEANTDWEAERKEAIDAFIARKVDLFFFRLCDSHKEIDTAINRNMCASFIRFALGIESVDASKEKV